MYMGASLRIRPSPGEDRYLLQLFLDPKTHKKTRLWALAVRLAHQGWTAPQIARFLGKQRTTIYHILRRFLQGGLASLVYRKAKGAPR